MAKFATDVDLRVWVCIVCARCVHARDRAAAGDHVDFVRLRTLTAARLAGRRQPGVGSGWLWGVEYIF